MFCFLLFDVILTSTATNGGPDVLGYAVVTAFLVLRASLYLRRKLYRCPECSFRADYDHFQRR